MEHFLQTTWKNWVIQNLVFDIQKRTGRKKKRKKKQCHVSHFRCLVSHVRCQVSGVKWQVPWLRDWIGPVGWFSEMLIMSRTITHIMSQFVTMCHNVNKYDGQSGCDIHSHLWFESFFYSDSLWKQYSLLLPLPPRHPDSLAPLAPVEGGEGQPNPQVTLHIHGTTALNSPSFTLAKFLQRIFKEASEGVTSTYSISFHRISRNLEQGFQLQPVFKLWLMINQNCIVFHDWFSLVHKFHQNRKIPISSRYFNWTQSI